MRRRVLALRFSPAHEAAFEALFAVRPWSHAAEDDARRMKPNGLHRLADRVPELAPSQDALARLLVEAALVNRQADFAAPTPSNAARQLFEQARSDPATLSRLVRRAPDDVDAWDACRLIYEPANRVRLVRRDGVASKTLSPPPEPIEAWVQECLSGRIQRPGHATSPYLRDATTREVDALIFAVWAGTESALKATSRGDRPSVAHVLAAVAEIPATTIARLWQERTHRPRREARR